ncbi:PD-(D/E)XK nuclease family protein [Kitasatospora sp. NPDC096147]|uniref:PD-(D/E)XK nuclease family protein n=1 Tax=Kitasatospora sp. NPDC096147 TaxID=3364093 RepID=UPI0037FCA06A
MEHQNWPLAQVIAELWRTRGRFSSHRRPAHAGLLEWTARALPRYLAEREAWQGTHGDDAVPRTVPMCHEWAVVRNSPSGEPDSRGATRYEQTAWGRRYASADGTVRDLWLPSIGTARRNRSEAELAAIAYVLARGVECPRPGFKERYQPLDLQPSSPPERVRVFGYGCGDGRAEILLDWDQQAVEQNYRAHAAPAFARAVEGVGVVPGNDCVGCKAIGGCTALERTPGLWGGRPLAVRRPRRSLSAWDLRLYKDCPAQYHLTRQLHLTGLSAEHESAIRGRLVDARLNDQHRERPARGCREIPGPVDPANWSAGGHSLSGSPAREAAAMLARHAALCPVGGLMPEDRLLTQRQLASYVPELDVVVFATPDLLYTRSGGWVWRETKTAIRRPWEGQSLMRHYPQLALGVLLLAAGVLGGELRRSRVELELLYADDSTCEELDPSRPVVVEEARQIIAEMAEPLLHDSSYEPRVGRHCHSCEAREWCAPGSGYGVEDSLPSTATPMVDDLSRGH